MDWGNGKYMTPEQLKAPFQYSRVLNIGTRDWDRMMQALAEPATHQDPGQAPEAVTAPVVAESQDETAKPALLALRTSGQ